MLNINLGRYSKAITAIIGQGLAFATSYYGGSHWVAAAVAIAAAMGVYAVPNSSPPQSPPPPPAGGMIP